MNKYQKKEFIIDLLKINQSIEKDRQTIDDFSKNFIDSAVLDLQKHYPADIYDNDEDIKNNKGLAEELNEVTISEQIEHLQGLDVEDEFFNIMFIYFENLMEGFQKSETIQVQGYSFDLKDIANEYYKLKEKYEQYGKSQDINNL